MKTFQDLMREHPIVVQQNTNTKEGMSDTLTRWYNLYWGTLTDTHMQLLPDGTYVVIGTKLTKDLWDQIMYNRVLSTAPGTPLPHCWYEVLQQNYMSCIWTTHNGAPAVAIVRKEDAPTHAIQIPFATTVSRNQCCNPCCGTPAVDDF